ncbi:hypothetical protein F0562_005668 [Nyssa sinensis]|uniref:Uncharacterized protein n=1 Tax=Nyssa sinensis TaxID=561372 RepID=A0A5J5AIR4_9ASTE|nr:hypothetical protein F0562_005668 [Nyssa sinensis]
MAGLLCGYLEAGRCRRVVRVMGLGPGGFSDSTPKSSFPLKRLSISAPAARPCLHLTDATLYHIAQAHHQQLLLAAHRVRRRTSKGWFGFVSSDRDSFSKDLRPVSFEFRPATFKGPPTSYVSGAFERLSWFRRLGSQHPQLGEYIHYAVTGILPFIQKCICSKD